MSWNCQFRRVIACVSTVLACVATAGPSLAALPSSNPMQPKIDRMDSYFFKGLRSPEVYRALSGMGDPQIDVLGDPQYQVWENASPDDIAKVKLLFPNLDYSQPASFYYHFGACRAEAPIRVLKERTKRFGVNHPYVKQWIAVERTVLAACAETLRQNDEKPPLSELPPPLETNDPVILRWQGDDRAYQQASLLFYENDLPHALEVFQAIADDKSSVDRPFAAYMVAAIRAGTNPKGPWLPNPMISPAESEKEVEAILADPSLVEVHDFAAQLIGWIAAQSSDAAAREAQVHEALRALEAPLGRIKTNGLARERYTAALTDITFLHSYFDDNDWRFDGDVPGVYSASIAMGDAAKTDPLAAWLIFPSMAYREKPWAVVEMLDNGFPPDEDNYLRARLKDKDVWRKNPWLHKALFSSPRDLRKYGGDTAKLAGFVDDEIVRVKKSDDDEALAALPFDFYNLERLLWTEDRPAKKPKSFAEALNRLQNFPFKSTFAYGDMVHDSLRYLITKGYLVQARQLRDRLHLDLKAHPDLNMLSYDTTGLLVVLAEDENHLVRLLGNREIYEIPQYLEPISIEELWRLAGRTDLTHNERAVFARTAWTRLYALGRVIDSKDDQLMRDLNPEIVKNWRSLPGHNVRPDDHIVLADVLASPAMNILLMRYMPQQKNVDANGVDPTHADHVNHDDANWWCPWKRALVARELNAHLQADFGAWDEERQPQYAWTVRHALAPALRESFVFRSFDYSELIALSKVDCGPKMLSERAIDWVKHPGWFDSTELQADALANAVTTTRWGCRSQGSHAAYSRQAFILLHAKFPKFAAAKRTKYWYSCIDADDCTKKDPPPMPSSH